MGVAHVVTVENAVCKHLDEPEVFATETPSLREIREGMAVADVSGSLLYDRMELENNLQTLKTG